MNVLSVLLRLHAAIFARVYLPVRRYSAPFFILFATFLLQACAKPYGSVVRRYYDAPVCCASIAELPVEPLRMEDAKSFELGAGSQAFLFDTGKSYFRVFALPQGGFPYKVTVSSYLVGDYLKSAYLFFPQLITLDEKRRVVRSTGPETFSVAQSDFFEIIQTGGEFRNKIEGGLAFTGISRDERYLVILTTDELLQGRTFVPTGEVPMLLVGNSGASPSKTSEVAVPHAPAGKVKVSLSSLSVEKPVTATVKGTSGAENAIAAANSEANGAMKPESAGGNESAPVSGRPETLIVRLAGGKVIGGLELGRAGIDEARRLFEKGGAGLGQERKSSTMFVIGKTFLAPERLYTPPGTLHQLYFDDNGILVFFVDGAAAELPPSGRNFRQRFPDAQETGRLVGSYELQTRLGQCVTLIAVFRTANDSLDSAAFAYGCPAK